MVGRTILAVALVFSGSVWAQAVISAHSGVVQLTEGTVELDGQAIQSPAKFGQFQDVKDGQTLTTTDGDAEVLLTPGVFLRLAENSSFRMVSNNLADTRVEVLSGTAMLQVGELLPDNAITVLFHNSDVELKKRGLYRFDSDPAARLRVYEGEARIASGDKKPVEAKKGHEVVFDSDKLEARNFDTKETDAFYRWNERRDEYIAQANITSARSAGTSGSGLYSSGAYSSYGPGAGTWAWNPWFGMFTFMPYTGMYYSPFGFGYYSPYTVGYLYMPGSPYYYGGVPASYGGVTRSGLIGSGARAGIGGAGVRGAGGMRGVGPSGGGIANSGSGGAAAVGAGGGHAGGFGGGISGGGGHAGGAGGRH
ncbi:MAG TPA: hypothetical protein VKX39_01405 [Bryobacteraceae bacterium]|nr:hypothetical protein [Bryobacteraceae bacterium]